MLDLRTIRELLDRHGEALAHRVKSFDVGGRVWDFERKKHLLGVINLSTESWYVESVCRTTEEAIARGEMLLREGADAIDLGAESTLPNAEVLDPARQIDELLPVVRALVERGATVSVESYHPEVLEACAQAGARIFNLTGVRELDAVLDLAARYEAAVILCYIQGDTVREVEDFVGAEDMVPELGRYFRELTARAEAKGVHRCFIDPGLGFYYRNLEDGRLRVRHQLDTFLHSFRLWELGHPILNILPHAPDFFGEEERRSAEPFFSVLAMMCGTHVIRTHELRTVSRIREIVSFYSR
jgi:dihydropteroate synthase